jgi:hypothetical protein
MPTGERSEYYRLRKRPGAPAPRSNGTHSIAAWREFARKEKAARAPSEKESLELEILKLKAERAAFDLAQARQEMREKILGELTQEFLAILSSIHTALFRMKNELAPQLEGRSARQIYSTWTSYERRFFENVWEQIRRQTGVVLSEEDLRPQSRMMAVAGGNGNGS